MGYFLVYTRLKKRTGWEVGKSWTWLFSALNLPGADLQGEIPEYHRGLLDLKRRNLRS